MCKTEFFQSSFGGADAEDACSQAGISYISINVAIVSMVQFSLINYLFGSKASRSNNTSDDAGQAGWGAWLQQLLPPPAAAALVGAVVSSMPQPVKIIINESFIGDVSRVLSHATVGSTVPLLGAVLYNERKREKDDSLAEDSTHDESIRPKYLAFLVGLQLIAMPWVSFAGLLFLKNLMRLSNPLLVFVAILANSTPSAIILLSLSILHGVSPRLISEVLLAMYVAAAVILPMNIALFVKVMVKLFPA